MIGEITHVTESVRARQTDFSYLKWDTMPSPIDLITQRTYSRWSYSHQNKYHVIDFLFELDLFVCIDDDYVTRATEPVSSKGQS